MVVIKWTLIVILALILLAVLAGQLGLLKGKPPSGLGVTDGKLKRPSYTPNSVSSQVDRWPDHPQREYATIAPLPLRGDGAATMQRLKAIVEAMPGATVIDSRSDYLYAQFTTRLMKFTDDAEFWFDPAAQAIQVRSASRVGRKDFGVNRARIEAIRGRLASG